MNISYIKIFEKKIIIFFEPVKTCKVHLLQYSHQAGRW